MTLTFNPLTGQFPTPPDPTDMLDLVNYERTSRELGADPVNWPDDTPADLDQRARLWDSRRQAARAAVEDAAEWTSVQCQQGNHEQCRDQRCTCTTCHGR